jgi:hypothetical protein
MTDSLMPPSMMSASRMMNCGVADWVMAHSGTAASKMAGSRMADPVVGLRQWRIVE